jgi:hypothetical protein
MEFMLNKFVFVWEIMKLDLIDYKYYFIAAYKANN